MSRLLAVWALVALSACGTTHYYGVDEEATVSRRPERGESGRGRGGPEATRPGAGRPGVVEARCEQHLDLVMATASRYNVDWRVVAAIITVESKWSPRAKNRSGASGLMQVMPGTGRRLKCGNLLDASQNVACGARLLSRLLPRYDQQLPYALAAYAAGARSVDAAYKAGRRPPKERFIARVTALTRAFGESGCRAVRTIR